MIGLPSLVKALALALVLAPAMASPVDQLEPRVACSADNCLRAVRASAFPTRMGTQDCSSYFITTVTPAISTITSTASFSFTSVVIEDVTFSTVLPITSTTIIEETKIDIATATDFITTFTIAIPVKRQVTVIPSVIPTYATACSGSVRYSSACSCIGVTATTITAATPLTTTTVSSTVPATTSTALVTVVTEVTTIVAATASVTTIDATSTTTTTVSATKTVEPVFECIEGQTGLCCSIVTSDFSSGSVCFLDQQFAIDCSGSIELCCASSTSFGGVFSGQNCVRA